MAVWIGVVTLPVVLRSTALIGYTAGRRGLDLVPSASTGRRRVLILYSGFTAACVVAYLLCGLGVTEALVVGLGTASTGGFTGQADSLAGYGGATQAVAGAGMFLAGAGDLRDLVDRAGPAPSPLALPGTQGVRCAARGGNGRQWPCTGASAGARPASWRCRR